MSQQPPKFSQRKADELIGGRAIQQEDESRRALYGNPPGVKFPPAQLAVIARDAKSHPVYSEQSVVDVIVRNMRASRNVALKRGSMTAGLMADKVASELHDIVQAPVEANIMQKVTNFCQAYGMFFCGTADSAPTQSHVSTKMNRLRLAVDYLRNNYNVHMKALQMQALSQSISEMTRPAPAFIDA